MPDIFDFDVGEGSLSMRNIGTVATFHDDLADWDYIGKKAALALNCHDELVEALRLIADGPYRGEARAIARAALAQVLRRLTNPAMPEKGGER